VICALRAHGYNVVDVPLSMLVARVAAQAPRIVLVDADSHGAFEVVARVRELPLGDDIPVLFIASRGGAIASPEEALAHEGSGLFVRPIDLTALVREVDALTSDARSRDHASAMTVAPAVVPTAPNLPRAPSLRSDAASLGVEDVRTPFWSARVPHAETFSSEPPTSPSWVPPPRSALVPPVSADLQRLLAEAEQRVQVASDEVWASAASSPEQEVEAMLPSELLAALDEPLDEDERDFDGVPGHSPSNALWARERTNDGGGHRTTSTSATASGDTPNATHATGPGTGHEPLAPPHARGSAGVSDGSTDPRLDPAVDPRAAVPPTVQNDAPIAWAGPWNAMRVVARSVAARASGSLCVVSAGIERRVVLHEGDIVTCASSAEDESLLSFLAVRGELPRDTVRRLGVRFPPFGRHAGAALVARGYLGQDQMWPTLRAHAEWLLGRILQLAESRAFMEAHPPGRLAGEPSVFGGGTGAAAFVEVVRRVVAPTEAVERLGGGRSRLGRGDGAALLCECGLAETAIDLVEGASGRTLREVLESAPDGDFATVILALTELGVTEVLRAVEADEAGPDAGTGAASALDAEAIRERVRARLQLVEDGDYFAVLGVPRDATGYEVRRAFLALRRAFEPSRLLSPELLDLSDAVRDIATVLEEAYEILKDGPRRERYRRAIEGIPGG
jgi:hypothetical protein